MKKKISGLLAALLLMIQFGIPMVVQAADGSLSLAVSASEVKTGETVKVTASAQGPGGGKATSDMQLTYDASKLSFVSCSLDNYSGGDGGTVNGSGSSFTVTLKATASGTASVKVSGSNGVVSESQEALSSMTAAGIKVNVGAGSAEGNINEGETGDNANKSADNSLSELSLSSGTLSPEFKYNVTSYTATVPGDVSKITVNAKPSNAKAEVASIKGADSLKDGENLITVEVKAENGTTVTYKINVTREAGTSSPEQNPENEGTDNGAEGNPPEATESGISINGVLYQVTGEFSDSDFPEGFSKTDISYQGQNVAGAKYNNGELYLLYLTSDAENAKKGFYVYDGAQNMFQPLVKLQTGEKSVIVLPKAADDTVPSGYTQSAASVQGTEGVSVFSFQGEPDLTAGEFYLIYGMDNSGQSGWYRYDSVDSTLQRYVESYAYAQPESDEAQKFIQQEYDSLDEKYNKEKSFNRKMMAILIFVIVVLVIICINVAIFKGGSKKGGTRKSFFRRKDDFWEDDYEDEEFIDDYDEEDDEKPEKVKKEKNGKKRFGFFGRNALSDSDEDLDDEEGSDEEDVSVAAGKINKGSKVPSDTISSQGTPNPPGAAGRIPTSGTAASGLSASERGAAARTLAGNQTTVSGKNAPGSRNTPGQGASLGDTKRLDQTVMSGFAPAKGTAAQRQTDVKTGAAVPGKGLEGKLPVSQNRPASGQTGVLKKQQTPPAPGTAAGSAGVQKTPVPAKAKPSAAQTAAVKNENYMEKQPEEKKKDGDLEFIDFDDL